MTWFLAAAVSRCAQTSGPATPSIVRPWTDWKALIAPWSSMLSRPAFHWLVSWLGYPGWKVNVPAGGAYAVDTSSFKLAGVEPVAPEPAAAGASAGMDAGRPAVPRESR